MRYFLFCCFVLFCSSIFATTKQKTDVYVKHLTFPENATLSEKIDMASHLVPSQRQIRWQGLEITSFIHFGINTFTGREWGDGTENPALFNPSQLDAEQWVKALKAGGFKMVILTAKHHDGFCLWQTKTTKHSVTSSPWKNGNGDVVKELKEACDKYGIKFGVYLSPWDRNAGCYGDSPKYNDFFVEQLTELLSNYGEIDEVWFDGACGEGANGKKQIYDWDRYYTVINNLQPNAVTAIMGDDVRWVGNEKGEGRETEWSATPLVPAAYPNSGAKNSSMGIFPKAKDLGSRDIIAKAKEMFWYPSEVDVSIRPGWFYHEHEDGDVKSLSTLVDIYFKSVGMNSVLLLNIPPDKRGLIHETDVKRIQELNKYITDNLSKSLIIDGVKATATKEGKFNTYKLKEPTKINTMMLREDISKGQHIESFAIEALIAGKWQPIVAGTTVGYKRLIRFAECETSSIRIRINSSRGIAYINEVAAYNTKKVEETKSHQIISEIPTSWWEGISFSGNDRNAIMSAIDSNPTTFWTSERSKGTKQITVDMGAEYDITGFSYLPRQTEDISGTVYNYKFYVSKDNITWEEATCPGEFSNIMHNPVAQFVKFGKTLRGRYFRFEALTEIEGRDFITIGDLGILVK